MPQERDWIMYCKLSSDVELREGMRPQPCASVYQGNYMAVRTIVKNPLFSSIDVVCQLLNHRSRESHRFLST